MDKRERDNETFKLKYSIDEIVKNTSTNLTNLFHAGGYRFNWNLSMQGYSSFFNYGMNTNVWRLFVNKQILMTYERLLIEKQLKEVNNLDKKLRNEIQNNE